jgi:hypothetical protein
MHEAEIRRLAVPGQPEQKSWQDFPSQGKMLGVVVVHTCHPNDSRNLETERS